MNDTRCQTSQRPEEQGSFTAYALGFILSLILTLASYYAVVEQLLVGWILLSTICTLGILQAIVQLVLFLHLGKEEKPRWNLAVFLFMALVLVIIVFGSIWIMDNLNYRTMPNM